MQTYATQDCFNKAADADFRHLAADIDKRGYTVLPNALSAAEIAETRQFIERELEKHKGEYFSFIGDEPVAGTLLQHMGQSGEFRRFLAQLSTYIMGREIEPGTPFQVLRVLAGETGKDQSMRFHYDAYAVTVLVPIVIPKDPSVQCGDLVLYPRLRPIRSNVVFNVVEKILMQNHLAQRLMASKLARHLFKAKVLRMDPGNIYLFWGYQCLHANEPCLPTSLRATAIFHYGDPHENNALTKLIKVIRRQHEVRKERALAG